MIAYKITNTTNGKSYIGITRGSLEKRWREHRCEASSGSDKPLYRAMRKYGAEAFDLRVLYEATSLQELKVVEKGLIAQYGTYKLGGKGYNLTDGGDGGHYINRAKGEQCRLAVLNEAIIAFIRDPEKVNIPNNVLVDMVKKQFGTEFNIDTLKCGRNGKGWRHLNDRFPPIKSAKGGRQRPITDSKRAVLRQVLDANRAVAVAKSAELSRGQRAKHAKLDFDTVKDIFYADGSLNSVAKQYGLSKKMVMLIRQQKTYVYWTKEFHRA